MGFQISLASTFFQEKSKLQKSSQLQKLESGPKSMGEKMERVKYLKLGCNQPKSVCRDLVSHNNKFGYEFRTQNVQSSEQIPHFDGILRSKPGNCLETVLHQVFADCH